MIGCMVMICCWICFFEGDGLFCVYCWFLWRVMYWEDIVEEEGGMCLYLCLLCGLLFVEGMWFGCIG